MSTERSLTRRSALAGIGGGSLGLLLRSPVTANQYVDSGGSGASVPVTTAGHALSGTWLSIIGLPSNPNVPVAVPSTLAPDGTAMFIFPGAEAASHGIEIRGVALGCWEPMSPMAGHFTVIQVLSDLEGAYIGTVTVDGFAILGDDRQSYEVEGSDHLFTVRDRQNTVVDILGSSAANPMRGFRMRAGDPAFPPVAHSGREFLKISK